MDAATALRAAQHDGGWDAIPQVHYKAKAKARAFTRLRRASDFLLSGQEKVTKEKATPDGAPSGHPALQTCVDLLGVCILHFAFEALNQSILNCSEHGKGKAWFSLSFIGNGMHPLPMATLPCVAGISDQVRDSNAG